MYRVRNSILEVLLVHPGGPFWKKRDEGAWSIPKGEPQPGEALLDAACREFQEELGFAPEGNFIVLSPIRQKAGKVVHAWAFEGDCEPARCRSNTFQIQWPPNSGKLQSFPEVDAVAFYDLATAEKKINPGQIPFLRQLPDRLRTATA
jgi:predicted NUDIX family NTP pyrophosphohydrolase